MKNKDYMTISELARILGITRIAVYKKIKKRQIKAEKIGNMYVIPKKYITDIQGKSLNEEDKKEIDDAVKKVVREYGEVLKLLGRE